MLRSIQSESGAAAAGSRRGADSLNLVASASALGQIRRQSTPSPRDVQGIWTGSSREPLRTPFRARYVLSSHKGRCHLGLVRRPTLVVKTTSGLLIQSPSEQLLPAL